MHLRIRALITFAALLLTWSIGADRLYAQATTPGPVASEASTVEKQIEAAMDNMRKEFGPTVLSDGRAELGSETVGEAWNRHLAAVGFPKSIAEREKLAGRLNLSQSSALILTMGAADGPKIQHVINELKRLAMDK